MAASGWPPPNTHHKSEHVVRAFGCSWMINSGYSNTTASLRGLGIHVDESMTFSRGQRNLPSMLKNQPLPTRANFGIYVTDELVFIAFRASKNINDWACDFNPCLSQLDADPRKGSCHKGFRDRSESFMGLANVDLINAILRSFINPTTGQPRQVILCGHSMGGAVAQLILARWFLTYTEYAGRLLDEHPELVPIAIGFGSPLFCDQTVADLIHDRPDMASRFLTFVNRGDPVPRVLSIFPNSPYTPVGLYVFLDGVPLLPSVLNSRTHRDELSGLLRRSICQMGEIRHHKLKSYGAALSEAGIVTRCQPGPQPDLPWVRHEGCTIFQPEVHSVTRVDHLDAGVSTLLMRGPNLVFVTEVTWDGLKLERSNLIVVQNVQNVGDTLSLTEVQLSAPTKKISRARTPFEVDIIVTTHFGECRKTIETTSRMIYRNAKKIAAIAAVTPVAMVATGIGMVALPAVGVLATAGAVLAGAAIAA